jgi:aspartyl-tRNA(Asn)/glutamyl-tRNA(Gln) amidotransferase subunit C
MIKLDKEELLKIAELSCLKLDNQEAEVLTEQIKLVLNYTEELEQVKFTTEVAPIKNINVFREDEVIPTDSKPILEQAPKTEKTYFVVPKILD